MKNSVTVKAPSSTANLGPGFDVFGLALNAFYDTITITKKPKGLTISSEDNIPVNPMQNTAGLVAQNIVKKFKIKSGLNLEIKKGVPAGYGMGSSAASAAAAAVAMNELFELKLSDNQLVEYAGIGEKAAAGSVHYDNVAASVLGGFVIVKTNPLDVIKIRPPKNLIMCIAIPKLDVPAKKTKVSRSVIPKRISMEDSVLNLANASAIVAGFAKKDPIMIGNSIKDVIVEPARKHMIPGFDVVKKDAIKAGAIGLTISGAGPSVISFAEEEKKIGKISDAMKKGFEKKKIDCITIICNYSKGATVVKKR